jgi:hypothetical protein
MTRIVEIIMRLLLYFAIVTGFTFLVAVGVLSVVADLLAMTNHRPPSFFDEFTDEDAESEDPESEDEEAEDWKRSGTSPYAVDAKVSRTVATDINAAH